MAPSGGIGTVVHVRLQLFLPQLRALGEAGRGRHHFVPCFIDADAPDLGRLLDHVPHAGCYPEITARMLDHGAGEEAGARHRGRQPPAPAAAGGWVSANAQARPYRGRYLPSRYSIR